MRTGCYDRSVRLVRDLSSTDSRVYLEFEVRRLLCNRCGHMKGGDLAFLTYNPFYTKRLAFLSGRRYRTAKIKNFAGELGLDWYAVKELKIQCMRAQLARAGAREPKAIGIGVIAIRKGHTYHIVVSNLIRYPPIWFGGKNRSYPKIAEFYERLGRK